MDPNPNPESPHLIVRFFSSNQTTPQRRNSTIVETHPQSVQHVSYGYTQSPSTGQTSLGGWRLNEEAYLTPLRQQPLERNLFPNPK